LATNAAARPETNNWLAGVLKRIDYPVAKQVIFGTPHGCVPELLCINLVRCLYVFLVQQLLRLISAHIVQIGMVSAVPDAQLLPTHIIIQEIFVGRQTGRRCSAQLKEK